MAKNTQIANAAVSAQADALARLLDGGELRIYGGAQPANADVAVTDQPLLVSMDLSDPCAPAAVNGVLSFDAPLSDSAVASGAATWFRLVSDAGVGIADGTVGLAADAPNLSLSATSINSGTAVSVTALQLTVAKAYSGL